MFRYRHILLTLDLIPEDDAHVCEHARDLVSSTNATLSLVHVADVSLNYGMTHATAEAYEELKQAALGDAHEELNAIGRLLDVPEGRQHVLLGTPREQILATAKRIGANLIIVGRHDHHGLAQYFSGSTAETIVNNADCDVLVVKVPVSEAAVSKYRSLAGV